MLKEERICGIVVTFHPKPEYLVNFAKICSQVDRLIVVDNGSDESEISQIRSASRQFGAKLIENRDNLGIACALNIGVREARKEDCQWVALFDQDSVITDGFIETMVTEFRECSRSRNIMQIIPRYLDPETGIEGPVSQFKDGGVFLTITSGSVFSTQVFDKCGLFREDLFIYCVDDDYSLRIRKSGFYIGISKKAVLLHQSGHPTSRKLFGLTISTKNYGPEIRYYYARNKVRILFCYGRTFPRLIVPTLREFVTIPLKIAIMEDRSLAKIKMFVRGLMDGITGRMGRLRIAE